MNFFITLNPVTSSWTTDRVGVGQRVSSQWKKLLKLYKTWSVLTSFSLVVSVQIVDLKTKTCLSCNKSHHMHTLVYMTLPATSLPTTVPLVNTDLWPANNNKAETWCTSRKRQKHYYTNLRSSRLRIDINELQLQKPPRSNLVLVATDIFAWQTLGIECFCRPCLSLYNHSIMHHVTKLPALNPIELNPKQAECS